MYIRQRSAYGQLTEMPHLRRNIILPVHKQRAKIGNFSESAKISAQNCGSKCKKKSKKHENATFKCQISGHYPDFYPSFFILCAAGFLLSANCIIFAAVNQWVYHTLGLLTACIWGTTFVASKLLLNAGMTPAEIMCVRFLIAWVILLFFTGRRLWCRTLRDEMLFVILGITGGSWYFFSENTALQIGTATQTVALIVCTTPVVSALLLHWFWREKLSSGFYIGSVVALAGVVLVVSNGVIVFDDNPWVAVLAASASLSWAVYSIVLRDVERRYSSAFITRKVFFWGFVTMLPYFLWRPPTMTFSMLLSPEVLWPMAYLAFICSLGCFYVWNIVVRGLGIVVSGNYLYFNPVTAMIVAAIVLAEPVTLLGVLGCLLVIGGVWLCNSLYK